MELSARNFFHFLFHPTLHPVYSPEISYDDYDSAAYDAIQYSIVYIRNRM